MHAKRTVTQNHANTQARWAIGENFIHAWTKLDRQNMIYPGRQKFSEEFYKYMHTTQELEEDRKISIRARGG
jgi:hypothetical protein